VFIIPYRKIYIKKGGKRIKDNTKKDNDPLKVDWNSLWNESLKNLPKKTIKKIGTI
jgi:hypothetical protein